MLCSQKRSHDMIFLQASYLKPYLMAFLLKKKAKIEVRKGAKFMNRDFKLGNLKKSGNYFFTLGDCQKPNCMCQIKFYRHYKTEAENN